MEEKKEGFRLEILWTSLGGEKSTTPEGYNS
jgi:hypothetical protein